MSWLDNTPDRPLDPPEYEEHEERTEPTHEEREEWIRERDAFERGALRARLGLTIRYIGAHSSFDKQDLIQLLKDCQRELGSDADIGTLPGALFRRQAD